MPGVKRTRMTTPASISVPAAPPPVLEEISLKDLPEFVERAKPSGDFRDFVLDLTEAGQAKAGKIIEDAAAAGNRKAKRQKTDNPTTICLLCVDSGTPLEGCFFHHKGNGGNKKKHFKNVHVEKKQLMEGDGYTFRRITELKGKLVGKTDRNVPPPPAPRFGGSYSANAAQASEAAADLERALAVWVSAANLPVESIEHPLFRKVLTVASHTRVGGLAVGKDELGKRIVEVGEKLRNVMRKRVSEMQPHRIHLLVGKDLETKQMRASLTFISDEDSNNLELNVLPVNLSSDSTDRIGVLAQALKRIDTQLEINALAGARNADGTNEYNFETICRASIERVSAGKVWDDLDNTKSHAAFDRLVNIVILSSLGIKHSLVDTDGGVPPGPPDSVAQAVQSLSGTNQWANLYGRLSEVLMEPDNNTQKKIFSEIQGILEPLVSLTQVLTQHPSKPSGAATLAAIALVLNRYGVELPQGLLYPESIKMKDDAHLKEIRFEVVELKNIAGQRKVVALKDFSPNGFAFYKCFVQHLIYRLSTKRGNRSCYEVLGLMVDPVMVKYGEFVFGKGSGDWNFDLIQNHVSLCVSKFDTTITTSTSTSTTESEAANVPVPTDASSLKEFIEVFEKYNPLEYWSNDTMQKKFPGLFRVNLVTLAYSSNSAVVDPSLTKRRTAEGPVLRNSAFIIRQAGKSQLEALDKQQQ